jgi:hypothetical protein
MLVITMGLSKSLEGGYVEVVSPSGEVLNIYLKQVKGKQIRLGFQDPEKNFQVNRKGINEYRPRVSSGWSSVVKDSLSGD